MSTYLNSDCISVSTSFMSALYVSNPSHLLLHILLGLCKIYQGFKSTCRYCLGSVRFICSLNPFASVAWTLSMLGGDGVGGKVWSGAGQCEESGERSRALMRRPRWMEGIPLYPKSRPRAYSWLRKGRGC